MQNTLERARFTSTTGEDNKDKDTGVYVTVKTADSKTMLAEIKNADNSSKDQTEYRDGSTHLLDLPILSKSPKAECDKFVFSVGAKANGNDQWKLRDGAVELSFKDGTNLIRNTGPFSLNSKGNAYVERTF